MGKIKIFIASPAEVAEERDVITYVVAELGRTLGTTFNVELEAIRWETHAWPDVGADGQDVINREIKNYDIFVGVMWKKFGSPTKRAESGTEEEFQRAYDFFKEHKKPKIMFYFCKRPFYSTRVNELKQFGKVVKFRQALEKLGVLYWEYESLIEFERRLREHLVRQIIDVNSPQKKDAHKSATNFNLTRRASPAYPSTKSVFLSYAHHDRNRVREIATDLRIAGINVWLDEDELLPGQDLQKTIEEAIKRSDAILVFVSKNTKEKNGYYYEELKLVYDNLKSGRNKKIRIIPVRLDPVEPDIILKKYMWIDVFSNEQMPELVKAIFKD